MIITPHMLVGAAIGIYSPGIAPAFGFGVLSHYLLDALPHWDYLGEIRTSKAQDFLKIVLDFIIGLVAVLALVWDLPQKDLIIAGVMGTLLPDCVQFIYQNLFKNRILGFLYRFHNSIHIWKNVPFWRGLPAPLIVSLAAIWILRGG